jgi:F420-dependent oxidoreductase-like protein
MQLAYLVRSTASPAEFAASADELRDLESAGLGMALVPEFYGVDAVSRLGYLAAKTSTVQLASGILAIYTRTPSLTAMTAAGLDLVSNGRFVLGLGASGPMVIEGFHGVPFNAPIGRTREIVEICRNVWAKEKVAHEGKHYTVPLSGGPRTFADTPVRARIPVMLASIGEKNIALAAEIAEYWLPIHFDANRAHRAFGSALADGLSRRDPSLGPLQVVAEVGVYLGDDPDGIAAAEKEARAKLALYVGGMGPRDNNFYNELAIRYGYEAEAKEIQDLFLGGDKAGAAAAVPDEFVEGVTAIGPAGKVKDRIAAFAEAGVTTMVVTPMGRSLQPGNLAKLIEELAAITA